MRGTRPPRPPCGGAPVQNHHPNTFSAHGTITSDGMSMWIRDIKASWPLATPLAVWSWPRPSATLTRRPWIVDTAGGDRRRVSLERLTRPLQADKQARRAPPWAVLRRRRLTRHTGHEGRPSRQLNSRPCQSLRRTADTQSDRHHCPLSASRSAPKTGSDLPVASHQFNRLHGRVSPQTA